MCLLTDGGAGLDRGEARLRLIKLTRPVYVTSSWTERDGLPSRQVTALAQTPDGYLWAGTGSGLARFDGVRFERWEAPDGSTVRDRSVSALYAGGDGSLWIGFGGRGGVSRFQGGDVTHYRPGEDLDYGRVVAFVEDADGTVWAGGLCGLFRFRDNRWERVGRRDGFAEEAVTSLYADSGGNLWIGTDEQVLVLKAEAERVEHHASVAQVDAISEDASGALWVSNVTGGLTKLGGENAEDHTSSEEVDRFHRVIHDGGGNTWGATLGRGLLRIPPQSQGTYLAENRFTRQRGLADDVVWTLFEDREGNIWAGTQTGLSRLTLSNVLSTVSPEPERVVRAVEAATDGTIWAATSDGVFRFQRQGQEWRQEELPSQLDVTALHVDRDGRLWMAALAGLYRHEDGRLLRVPMSGITRMPWVTGMTSDNRGGLWLCDRDGRLLLWRTDELTLVSASGVDTRSARTVHADRDGNVWIGFADGGVVIFRDGSLHRSSQLDLVTNGSVNTLFEDERNPGVMWIGTSTSLDRFDSGRLTSWPLDHLGLGTGLGAIVDDKEGNLWLGLRSGIIRLNPRELDRAQAATGSRVPYRLLDESDGLGGSAGSTGGPAAVRARDGSLWFITGSRISVVSPTLLPESQPAPSVRIERVYADQERLPLTGDIRVLPRTSRIQFDYTAMTLSASERVEFRYLLEGFDDDWVHAGRSRQAVYTNLRPGRYRFNVVAASKDGIWADSGASTGIVLAPSFRQTGWVVGLLAAAGAVGGWVARRFRVRRLRQEFGGIVRERVRVAREIHDTLLQTLAGLALKVATVEEQMGPATDLQRAKQDLAGIRKQIQRSIRETRQSIWDLRSPDNKPSSLETVLREAGSTICEKSGSFDLVVHGKAVRYPRTVEQELLGIVKESLRNAVHHSAAERVRVDLQYTTAGLCLRLSDDGRGFRVDESTPTSGNQWGLIGIRERAEQIGARLDIRSRPGAGTVVEVTVPIDSEA